MYAIDKKQFGAFVSELRKEKGYTQKELAGRLFVSDKAVSKWETGSSIPDTALLIPLAEQLGVTVTELLLCHRSETESLSRAEAEQAAAEAKDGIEYGDCIGTVWVEGTEVNCDLYWGDTTSIFRAGAGCSADNGCVMPGENGTVFVGAHTDTYFNKLFDAEVGALIHLDTIYGDFVYQITDFEVIGDTEVDKCRWGATEPSCILYTCYPQGIQTPTRYRYLAYADPVETDENGVVPSSLPGMEETGEEATAEATPAPEEPAA